jgi:adenine-specific DNA-methyltransferase
MRRHAHAFAENLPSSTDLDTERKRNLGIYYTPRNAAELLARWAIRCDADTVLEPSFGGCTILEAAVNRLRALGSANPAKQLSGYDVDPDAFAYLDRLLGANARYAQFSLRNFLSVPEQRVVSSVIGNPPFVSYHRMNQTQRTVVRAWRRSQQPPFPMTASLWAYFLYHAISFLLPGGRLAFVLPSAATSSDYAKPIINTLRQRFSRVLIFRLSEQLFIQAGADERTVVLLADGHLSNPRGGGRLAEHTVTTLADLELRILDDEREREADTSNVYEHRDDNPADIKLQDLARLGTISALGDVASVAIGEVVGDTEFFVRQIEQWKTLGIPTKHLRPLITRSRQLSGLRITAREVRSRYVGLPLLLLPPESRIPASVASYLETYPTKERVRNSTFAKRQPWFAVSHDSSAKGFIASMSHASPRIILNTAHVSCANGLYKLTPRRGVPWRSCLAAASLTTVFRLSAELEARVRGSGALKLEPSNARRLLLPLSFASLGPVNSKSLIAHLDKLIRAREYERATRFADDALLIKPGILTQSDVRVFRDRFQDLQAARLQSKSDTHANDPKDQR